MTLYHVSPANLAIGTELQPGRFGNFYRQYRAGGPMPTPENISNLLWEICFEAVRQAVAPTKPSRLDCVFAAESLEMAKRFRDKYRGGCGTILKVETLNTNMPCHRGDFSFMSTNFDGPYIEHMSRGAVRYWTEEPKDIVELLYPCPLRVVGAV